MITIDSLKKTIQSLNYIWFEDKPNIIAIRTKLQVPDVFNDILCIVYKKNNIEYLYTTTITTEPGVYYQKKLLNPKGCWVMMPAQMIDAYAPGFHQNKTDHRCLRSLGKIYGLREDDKDGIIGNDKDAVATWVEGSTVGANIHGAKKLQDLTEIVGQNSAGCQVHSRWSKKEEMMDIVEKLYPNLKRVTYTLIKEEDLKS
jgi:hypothetical protein